MKNSLSISFFHTYHPFSAGREKRPIKSLVVGRPILLALEDIDGSPSFLEKALRFLERHGTDNHCSLSVINEVRKCLNPSKKLFGNVNISFRNKGGGNFAPGCRCGRG